MLRCTFVGRLVTPPYVYDEFVTCHDLTQCPLRRSSSSVVNDNGPPEVARQRHLSTNVHFRSNPAANTVNWNASAAAEVNQWQTTTGNESTRPEVTKRKQRCRSSAYDDELSADHISRTLLIPGHTRPSALVVKDSSRDLRGSWRAGSGDEEDRAAAQSLDRGVAPVKKQTRFLLAEYGLESDSRDTPV